MLKIYYLPCLVALFLSTSPAQSSLDSIMFQYERKFWNGSTCVFVQGSNSSSYPEKLNSMYHSWSSESRINVKNENELDTSDLKKHLNFWGPVYSYSSLIKFLPAAITIIPNGFKLGEHEFTDSLDAISLISSDGTRRFQLANSMEGLLSLWTTFQDISQYFVMQKYAITYHGFLKNNQFDSSLCYDVVSLHNATLKKHNTKYYTFFYDPSIFNASRNIDSMFAREDDKLEHAISVLKFNRPDRKIECYLYKNLEQKYQMSATPGYGNPFIEAYQNHSVGFGPTEHESIHILQGKASTIFSEGLVGYYYSTEDSLEWKKNNSILSRHPSFSMGDFLGKVNRFDFSELSYAASAHLAKFLIDTYGLDKYKAISRYEDIHKGFEEVYKLSFDDIILGWSTFFQSRKIPLGSERKITFDVTANSNPDSCSVYISGDIEQLGFWNGHGIKLEKAQNGHWQCTIPFAEGTVFSYKITRGSWDKEALDSNGNVPGNSMFEVKNDDTIRATINMWKDQIK